MYQGVTSDEEFQQLMCVNEVLLDNWTVIGVYMTYDMYDEYSMDDELYDVLESHFGGVHIIDGKDYQEFMEY